MKNFTLCYLLLLTSSACAAKPMNIVILYADDVRHDSLSVAGNPVVKTPCIDKLAGESVRFTRSYVTTSICGVSRASLHSGQWMSRHGARNFSMWDTPWEHSFPALLRENGYYTGHVGKWHNAPEPKGKFDFSRFYHGKHWYADDHGKMIHSITRNEVDAMEFLRGRPQDKPFYLNVAFFTPHAEDGHPDQFLPQPETLGLYQDISIPVPFNATEESWRRLPPFFTEKNEGRNRYNWRFNTPDKYQRMMKNYYRLISGMDTTIGRLLDELAKQGVLDNTLLILTADNGYFHGEHGLADKWYPHEESIRVPLIIRDPRTPIERKSTTNDAMTLNVDLAPTILSAADIPIPGVMQGRDIAPLYLAAAPPAWRTEFFYEHAKLRKDDFIPASEALVRKDWKYIFWPKHEYEQLFDLTQDPHEENDLAKDPAHTIRLAEMRARFTELKAAAR